MAALTGLAEATHTFNATGEDQRNSRSAPTHSEMPIMLHYAAVFFVIAIVAAVLGFGGLAAGAAGIAKILFFIFLLGAIASLIIGGINRASRA
jgi:uncharacterized membrane protein YtjA (UPF0391 family)